MKERELEITDLHDLTFYQN